MNDQNKRVHQTPQKQRSKSIAGPYMLNQLLSRSAAKTVSKPKQKLDFCPKPKVISSLIYDYEPQSEEENPDQEVLLIRDSDDSLNDREEQNQSTTEPAQPITEVASSPSPANAANATFQSSPNTVANASFAERRDLVVISTYKDLVAVLNESQNTFTVRDQNYQINLNMEQLQQVEQEPNQMSNNTPNVAQESEQAIVSSPLIRNNCDSTDLQNLAVGFLHEQKAPANEMQVIVQQIENPLEEEQKGSSDSESISDRLSNVAQVEQTVDQASSEELSERLTLIRKPSNSFEQQRPQHSYPSLITNQMISSNSMRPYPVRPLKSLPDCLTEQEETLNIQQNKQVQHQPEQEEEKVQNQASDGYESGDQNFVSIPLSAKPKPKKKVNLNLNKVDINKHTPEMLSAALQPKLLVDATLTDPIRRPTGVLAINDQPEEVKGQEVFNFDAMLNGIKEEMKNERVPEVQPVMPHVPPEMRTRISAEQGALNAAVPVQPPRITPVFVNTEFVAELPFLAIPNTDSVAIARPNIVVPEESGSSENSSSSDSHHSGKETKQTQAYNEVPQMKKQAECDEPDAQCAIKIDMNKQRSRKLGAATALLPKEVNLFESRKIRKIATTPIIIIEDEEEKGSPESEFSTPVTITFDQPISRNSDNLSFALDQLLLNDQNDDDKKRSRSKTISNKQDEVAQSQPQDMLSPSSFKSPSTQRDSDELMIPQLKFERITSVAQVSAPLDSTGDQSKYKHVTKDKLIQRLTYLQAYYEQEMNKFSVLKRSNRQIDIGFLHASPLIYKGGVKQALPPLKFVQEARTIKNAVRGTGQKIIFKSMVATHQNLSEMVNLDAQVLHIACHGNKKQGMCMERGASNFVFLEKQSGEGELVTESTLKKLMKSKNIELIFVSAYESQLVGEIFQKCGARHIICVRQDRDMENKATTFFIENFYARLFKSATICAAYKDAKADVKHWFPEHEPDLFSLLLKEDANHSCQSIEKREVGNFQCISSHIQVQQIPVKEKGIDFRENQTANLVEAVMDESKAQLIVLLGLRGIGKSAIAKNALHYMRERRFITGGVILIDLKKVKSMNIFETKMKKMMTKSLNLTRDSDIFHKIENAEQEHLYDYLEKFFEQSKKNDEFLLKNKPIPQQVTQKFVLCLDNAEDIIQESGDGEEFHSFLANLLERCKDLVIIITSQKHLSTLSKGIQPEIQHVKPLKLVEAVGLFLEHAGSILPDDIYDIILKDVDFPICKIDNTLGDRLIHPVSQETKSKILGKLYANHECQEIALVNHDLFSKLAGNPLSIRMLAAQQAKKNDLKQIYKKIQNTKNSFSASGRESHQSRRLGEVTSNVLSLRLSAEASIQMLRETMRQGFNLFYLIGCLPDGIKKEHLEKLWSQDQEIEEGIGELREMDLLDQSHVDKLCLKSVLIEFAQESIEASSLNEMMENICEFYTDFLKSLYKVNSALVQTSNSEEKRRSSCKSPERRRSSRQKLAHQTQTEDYQENFKQLIQLQAKTGKKKALEKKSLINEIMADMGNIEYCLQYFTKLAEENTNTKATEIESNNHIVNRRNTTREKTGSRSTQNTPVNKPKLSKIIDESQEDSDNQSKESALSDREINSINSSNEDNDEKQKLEQQDQSDTSSTLKEDLEVARHRSSYKKNKGHSGINMGKRSSVLIQLNPTTALNEEQRKLAMVKATLNRRQTIVFGSQLQGIVERGESTSSFNTDPTSSSESSSGTSSNSSSSNSGESDESNQSIKEDKEDKQFFFSQSDISPLNRKSSNGVLLRRMTVLDHKKAFQKKAINNCTAVNATSDNKNQIIPGLGIGERIIYSSSESELEDELDHDPLDSQSSNNDFYSAFDQMMLDRLGPQSPVSPQIEEVELDDVDKWLLDGKDLKVCLLDSNSGLLNDKEKDNMFDSGPILRSQSNPVQKRKPIESKVINKTKELKRSSKEIAEAQFQFDQNMKQFPVQLQRQQTHAPLKRDNKSDPIVKRKIEQLEVQNPRLQHRATQIMNKKKKDEELDFVEKESTKQTQQWNKHRVSINPVLHRRQTLAANQMLRSSNLAMPTPQINTEFSAPERFILYYVANIFLATDFQKCFKVCSANYSYIANSNIFESNILRFKSLALEHIYGALKDDEQLQETPEEQTNLLLDAIEATQNSLKISKLDFANEVTGGEKNVHGIALAQFQLGCLYEKHYGDLIADKSTGSAEFLKRLDNHFKTKRNKKTCFEEAKKCFNEAYYCFKKLNHLQGEYLALKHKLAVIDCKVTKDQEIEKIHELVIEQKAKYEKYVTEVGLSESSYISREQSEEISVMTELALVKHMDNLFQVPLKTKGTRKIKHDDIMSMKSDKRGTINQRRNNNRTMSVLLGQNESLLINKQTTPKIEE